MPGSSDISVHILSDQNLAPEWAIPAQLEHAPRLTGERRLLVALLASALRDLEHYTPLAGLPGRGGQRAAELVSNARKWLAGTHESKLSLEQCCRACGLDEAAVRKALEVG